MKRKGEERKEEERRRLEIRRVEKKVVGLMKVEETSQG